jgi:hypothetical protein
VSAGVGGHDAGPVDEERASSGSLLGMLQRGRGLGHQRALTTPGADALVLDCLAHEPRWDRQTEQRAGYYARLVLALDVPVEAIGLGPDGPDAPGAGLSVAFETLVELSRRGSGAAASALHEYLRRSAPDWHLVSTIWTDGGPAARRGLAELVLDRIDDACLAAVVTLDEDGPWRTWAAHDPRVADALAALPPRPQTVRPDLTGHRTADLRALAEAPPSPQRAAALRALGARGDLWLLDLAERTDLRGTPGARFALRRPVLDLGPAALPRSRAWIEGDDPWLRDLGQDVVSAHGGPDDAGTVLTWFDQAVADGAWCRTETFADGLARLRHRPAAPSLVRAWERTPHSIARRHHLRALVAVDAPGLPRLLGEARDDCEADVRAITRTSR